MLNLQDSQTKQQKSVSPHADHIDHQDRFSHRHFSIPISLKTPCNNVFILQKLMTECPHGDSQQCVWADTAGYRLPLISKLIDYVLPLLDAQDIS